MLGSFFILKGSHMFYTTINPSTPDLKQVMVYFSTPEIASLYKPEFLKPQTPGSVACDLICPEDVTINNVLDSAFINFGISIKPPTGYYSLIIMRSSTFKKFGVILCNHIGLIDSDYSGPTDLIGAQIQCTSRRASDSESYATFIPKGTRIAQLFIVPMVQFEFVPQLTHWGDSSRGGFGSTGK